MGSVLRRLHLYDTHDRVLFNEANLRSVRLNPHCLFVPFAPAVKQPRLLLSLAQKWRSVIGVSKSIPFAVTALCMERSLSR